MIHRSTTIRRSSRLCACVISGIEDYCGLSPYWDDDDEAAQLARDAVFCRRKTFNARGYARARGLAAIPWRRDRWSMRSRSIPCHFNRRGKAIFAEFVEVKSTPGDANTRGHHSAIGFTGQSVHARCETEQFVFTQTTYSSRLATLLRSSDECGMGGGNVHRPPRGGSERARAISRNAKRIRSR